jgi:nucleotide-binding universal stress UspA family protein
MSNAESYLGGLFPEPRTSPLVSTVAFFDEPARMIVEEVERRSVDLVVMATHRRAGRGAWLYGSVADQVFRHVHVPVIVLPPDCVPHWENRPDSRILVPLDGSRVAEEVLRPAIELARALHAGIVLARVVEADTETAGAMSYLEATAAALRSDDLSLTPRVVVGGNVSESILTVARESDVDAIALSTHGWGGLAHRLMGGVASGLVKRANVPLMLVRPTAMRKTSPHDSGLNDCLEAANAARTEG